MDAILDGLVLGTECIWTDQWEWTPIPQAVRTAIDGGVVVETIFSSSNANRPLTLDVKKLTKAKIDTLLAKRDTYPPTPFSVSLCEGTTFTNTVLFRHHDMPPVVVKPYAYRSDYSKGADYWEATIKLFLTS